MQQSNIIAGFVFTAFLIYITLKGELPQYMGFLLSGAPASYAPPTASVGPVGGGAAASGKGPDFGGAPAGVLGGSGGGSDLNSMMNDPSGKGALTIFGNAALMMFGMPPVAGTAANALTSGAG